jgi:hypothetical protein
MGIFKDLRLFFSYRKAIKKNKVNLEGQFNMRIDNADRLYTVLNIPSNLVEEPYNLRKSDIDAIAQNYIRDYVSELSAYLNSIGASELYDFYEPIKKVDKYSYLIVIGYKSLDSVEINKILYRVLIPTICVIGLISLAVILLKS